MSQLKEKNTENTNSSCSTKGSQLLNGAIIRIQSAMCHRGRGKLRMLRRWKSGGESNSPIDCNYRTNKLQSGTLSLLPHCPHCSIHPVTLQIQTPGLRGRFLWTSAPEQDHFHKETSAPSESTKLPLNCLRPGSAPGPNPPSLCLFDIVSSSAAK